jgi:DNA-directed RNA polymerase specialized sigma24 family protein
MPSIESITQWIHQLKDGDRDAVQKLWEGYFLRLDHQTQNWLRRAPPRAVGAEDIALSAFDSFCRRAEQGRFPRLDDRDDLWQLLVVIAFRKTCNQVKHDAVRQPRTGRVILISQLDARREEPLFARLIDREPDPALAVEVADSCRRLLDLLPTAELRQVAMWKLEGYTNEEIAPQMNGGAGRDTSTVERKLKRIRRIWAKEIRS